MGKVQSLSHLCILHTEKEEMQFKEYEKKDSLPQMGAKCAAEDELPYTQSSSSHKLHFSWDFSCKSHLYFTGLN